MRIAVWGSGYYYKKFKKYIRMEDVAYIIDNDEKKVGSFIDEKEIKSPQFLNTENLECILILVKNYEEIIKQLSELGISKRMILTYENLSLLTNKIPCVTIGNYVQYLSEWVECVEENIIFICTHCIARSGVPIVLMNMANLLLQMGYKVLLGTLEDGSLEEEIKKYRIPYIKDIEIFFYDKYFTDFIKNTCEFVFLGTIALADYGRKIAAMGCKIKWWLHESESIYYKNYPLPKDDNIIFYGGGERVISEFKKYYTMQIRHLLYYLPEKEQEFYLSVEEKITFICIGEICKRKAQDILISALQIMNKSLRHRIKVIFAGSKGDLYIDWKNICKVVPEIIYENELNQIQIEELYKKADYLICPSRDDPMPLVVTQAFQHGIPCIISDEVGQSQYIKSGGKNEIFRNEDKEQLKQILEYLAISGKRTEPCYYSRKIYEDYFSEKVMRKTLRKIIDESNDEK